MHKIGNIDINKYTFIEKRIHTNEVIITDERIRHICERRGLEFYDKYKTKFAEIIKDPDYIFKDCDRQHTILVCKRIVADQKYVNIVLRLAMETDNPKYKNSIITAIEEGDKRFKQRLRNNEPLYKKE